MLKIIKSTAEKNNIKASKVYEAFIEMSYQLTITLSYDVKYKYLNDDFNLFIGELQSKVVEKPFFDLLGQTLAELNQLDKKSFGQCFTPSELSFAVSKMMDEPKGNNYYHFGEPACGSGALLLSKLGELSKNKEIEVIDFLINDLDELMLKTALLQLQLNSSLNCEDKKISIVATNANLITEWNKPNTIIFHRDTNFINDEYVIRYFDAKRKEAVLNNVLRLLS